MRQLVNLAASGDSRAAQMVLSMAQTFEAMPAAAQPLSSEADLQLKRDLIRRIQQMSKASEGESDENP